MTKSGTIIVKNPMLDTYGDTYMGQSCKKTSDGTLRFALLAMGSAQWNAGTTYLRSLLYALAQDEQSSLEVYLLTSEPEIDHRSLCDFFPRKRIISCEYQRPQRGTLRWFQNKSRLIRGSDTRTIGIHEALQQHGINVLFSGTPLNSRNIATLLWIPDFQHVHYPELFSEVERKQRDESFRLIANSADRVILISEAVRSDFVAFAPTQALKARVSHPVSYIPAGLYHEAIEPILKLYDLQEKFFYVPNTFWKHKNHETLFRAVKILSEGGMKIVVVCSGYPRDYRHPEHFTDIFQKLSEWHIREQVKYVGVIPHSHVLALVRQSICVVNPSLFEGWGISVDEARSVGKQTLISDIPAHREQDPPGALYFSPLDSEELAEKMAHIWKTREPGPDVQLELEARQCLPNRMTEYARTFVSVAEEAYQDFHGRPK